MENNGSTAPVIEEPIQEQEVLDTINQSNNEETEVQVSESEVQSAEKDLTTMTKEDLVAYLTEVIQTKDIYQLRHLVDKIKIAFYKLHNFEVKTKVLADEPIEEDPLEIRFKELLSIYKTRKEQYIVLIEHEKEVNYKAKLAIIDELKALTETNEFNSSTYTKFNELQNKWREIGIVPQNVNNDLWETYNHYREIFFNLGKINKELRDCDFKKNLEAKTILCERAEKLFESNAAVESFHDLQKLHEEWKEIGPVPSEVKDALWERFHEASSKINKRHQEYFEQIKEEQLKNLQLKEELCEKIEAIDFSKFATHKEWEDASNNILEIQKVWKTIGFAPKKDNGPIYERYRKACDTFFEAKHGYTDDVKKTLDNNYHAKVQICQQAEEFNETLTEDTDWKQGTEFILSLQKNWKEIGPTARKHSDLLWKRFRAACDKFFETKSSHFKDSENEFVKHLHEKQALLEEIKQTINDQLSFDLLKGFQERWSAIGFVPMKEKEKIQKEFKETMDALYKQLRGNESERRVDGFRRKIENIRQSGRLGSEHDKLIQKMHVLEGQISTLENNIGFFSNSKKAESLIKDVQTKIEAAKCDLKEIIEKIKMLEKENG